MFDDDIALEDTEKTRHTTIYLPPRTGPTQASSFYNSSLNQTNVFLRKDLVLFRNEGGRLLLAPIYSVLGGVITHPRSVLLRFNLFAQVGDVLPLKEFEIVADGKEMRPTLSVSQSLGHSESGEVIQDFRINLADEEFLKVVGATSVSFEIDATKIELSAEQLEALRDLQRCADAGACL